MPLSTVADFKARHYPPIAKVEEGSEHRKLRTGNGI